MPPPSWPELPLPQERSCTVEEGLVGDCQRRGTVEEVVLVEMPRARTAPPKRCAIARERER